MAARRQRPLVFVAEERREARRRVEARRAQPVDRAVDADQRRGLGIADQCVVFEPEWHALRLLERMLLRHGTVGVRWALVAALQNASATRSSDRGSEPAPERRLEALHDAHGQIALEQPIDLLEVVLFLRRNERDRLADGAGTAGSADAVDVVVRRVRQLEVDDDAAARRCPGRARRRRWRRGRARSRS